MNAAKTSTKPKHLPLTLGLSLLYIFGSCAIFLQSEPNKIKLLQATLLLTGVIISYLAYSLYCLSQQTKHLANTDPLTQLMNRRSMDSAAQVMISLNARLGQHMCFFIVDIDNLKAVNDKYGQTTGDQIIIEVSTSFKSSLRESDIVSRHDGKEFLIILPNTGAGEGYRLAERLRKQVEDSVLGKPKAKLTISIGCAELRKDETYDEVIKRVDDALDCAKNGGRNRIVVA